MKWFKHDVDANTDAKLRRLVMRFGMEGYGIYWYCLELIAQSVNKHKLTFELEHDAELIAFSLNLNKDHVEDLMRYMVELNLFENNGGRITCLKMLNRLDSSMVSDPGFRDSLRLLRGEISPQISTESDSVMMGSCKNRTEQNRTEQKKNANKQLTNCLPADADCDSIPFAEILDAYRQAGGFEPVLKMTDKRRRHIRDRWRENPDMQTVEAWREFWLWVATECKWLMAQPKMRTLDWITKNADNFAKVREGRYSGA